jgi:hypothetical protein
MTASCGNIQCPRTGGRWDVLQCRGYVLSIGQDMGFAVVRAVALKLIMSGLLDRIESHHNFSSHGFMERQGVADAVPAASDGIIGPERLPIVPLSRRLLWIDSRRLHGIGNGLLSAQEFFELKVGDRIRLIAGDNPILNIVHSVVDNEIHEKT